MNPEQSRTYVFTLVSGKTERVSGYGVFQTKTHLEVWSKAKQTRLASFLKSEVVNWDTEKPEAL